MTARNCNGCKFAVFADTGYSNWTVEGTDFLCGQKLHPDAPFDRWYGEDKRLEFAQNCSGFEAGEPIAMDVEGENLSELTTEQRAIYDAAMTGQAFSTIMKPETDLTIPLRPQPCRRCAGFGYLPYVYSESASAVRCPACNGTGKARLLAIRLDSRT